MRLRVALLLVACVGIAHADSTRRERPLAIGLAVPDELYIAGHDVTIPLPTVHLGYALSPVMSLELGVGGMPMANGAHALLAHVGARYRLGENALVPFAMARLGVYDDKQDEGPGGTYPFAIAGGGLEYVHSSRLGLWIDLGAGVADVDEVSPALSGSIGVAVRL